MLSCSLTRLAGFGTFKPLSRDVSSIHHPCSAGKPLFFLVCLFVFYTHQPCKHTALTPQRLLPEATTNTAQEQHEELGKEPRHPDSNVICHQNKPHPRGPPLRPKLTTLQDPKDPLHRPKTTRSIPQPVRAVHLSSFGKLFRSFWMV